MHIFNAIQCNSMVNNLLINNLLIIIIKNSTSSYTQIQIPNCYICSNEVSTMDKLETTECSEVTSIEILAWIICKLIYGIL